MTERTRPSLNFTIICDDVRQEAGGKISLMGLFENIYAVRFPAIHPRLAVVNEWADGKGEFESRMRILSPDKKTVLRETVSSIKLPDLKVRHRDISMHLNIEFKAPGTYWLDIFLDSDLICSLPLQVVLVKEQSFH